MIHFLVMFVGFMVISRKASINRPYLDWFLRFFILGFFISIVYSVDAIFDGYGNKYEIYKIVVSSFVLMLILWLFFSFLEFVKRRIL